MTSGIASAISELDNQETISDLLIDFGCSHEELSPGSIEAIAVLSDPNQVHAILSDLGVVQRIDNDNQRTLRSWFDKFIERKSFLRRTSKKQYYRTIPHFLEFASATGVNYPGQVDEVFVDDYVEYLLAEFNAEDTCLTYSTKVHAYLAYLADRGQVPEQVVKLISKPEVGLTSNARSERVTIKEMTGILTNLRKQRYGTNLHVLGELTWNTGPRIGGIHSVDLDLDFDGERGRLDFVHRPDQGTSLKLGTESDQTPGSGERQVSIPPRVVEAVEEFALVHREEVTDEFGRDPLFTTKHGRASKSTLRRWIYEITSCRWNDVSDEFCDGSCRPDGNICPRSINPHGIRRGAIVAARKAGLSLDDTSERFNVNPITIKRHYEPRDAPEQADDRADRVEQSWEKIYESF